MEIKRTFDLIPYNAEKFPRDDMFAGKVDRDWVKYSSELVQHNVNAVSYALLAMGYGPGDKIATITANKPEWNFMDQGMGQIGIIHVPIYPTIGEDEYEFILMHSDVKAVVVGNKALYQKLKPIIEKTPAIKETFSFERVEGLKSIFDIIELGEANKGLHHDRVVEIRDSIKPEDMVTIIYTSGTTGNSKGVMLSHSNLISNAKAATKVHPFGFGDRAISFLPLCHVYERMLNYHHQMKGISVYYVENMAAISEMAKEVKPSIMTTVPRLMEKIYDSIINKGKNLTGIKKQLFFWAVNLGLNYKLHNRGLYYNIRLAIARKLIFSKWQAALGGELGVLVSGGAALQHRLERIFWAAGIPVLQGYGLTETSPVIAVNPLDIKNMKFETVGPAVEDVEIRIAEDGEILTKGPHIMMGYYKAPDMTAEVIDKDGWFHTGDIGRIEDGRFLRITDRKKEIFKLSAGKYIAPQPIENKIKESLFIEQAMVIGENEKFASALISPNFAFLHDWCSRHQIQYRDNAELVSLPIVIDRYNKEIAEVNKSLGEFEQIKRIRLVTEEWNAATGELSPTLKLKRNYLTKRYASLIGEIYFAKK